MKKKSYVCSYWVGGDKYSETIYADDWADAERIARSRNLVLDGELISTVPCELGWLAKTVVWFRNLLR